MATDGSRTDRQGLAASELLPGELVLRRWTAPGGRGLLTNQRCLLLGRPFPRRRLLWSQELELVGSLVVEKVRGLRVARVSVRGALGGGVIGPGRIDPTYCVEVDGVRVFLGYPNDCERIQGWIDDARAARCVELYGRVIPFGGAAHGGPLGAGAGPRPGGPPSGGGAPG